ncbi:MAPK regulated corepressor interacting protein 2-like [Aplochiton taeniatus]
MMYTITRGPSKLVTQRRTGPTQPIDNKINDFKHKQTSWSVPDLPAPKIVFNRLNGKKYHQTPVQQADPLPEEGFTAAHEDNVRFVYQAWQQVEEGCGSRNQSPVERDAEVSQGAKAAVHYTETSPGPHMQDFVPLDLDEWWAQRFLANIDKLS